MKKNRKARSSETTSPYKRVKLKRPISYRSERSLCGYDAPMWVEVFYGGCWQRIKLCKNENDAIDVICDIAEKMREE